MARKSEYARAGVDYKKIEPFKEKAGYCLADIGLVKQGKRRTVFEPEGITLPPPGQ